MKIKNGYPETGKCQRKIKMAVPMRDGDFENQNMVSRCGTTVLKTKWHFPEPGRAV